MASTMYATKLTRARCSRWCAARPLPRRRHRRAVRARPSPPRQPRRTSRCRVLYGDRAHARDLELLQVAEYHAGVLPRDIAQDHVSGRLRGGPVEVDDVEHGLRPAQDLERLVRHVLRRDDPHVDHAEYLPIPARTSSGISFFSAVRGSMKTWRRSASASTAPSDTRSAVSAVIDDVVPIRVTRATRSSSSSKRAESPERM